MTAMELLLLATAQPFTYVFIFIFYSCCTLRNSRAFKERGTEFETNLALVMLELTLEYPLLRHLPV